MNKRLLSGIIFICLTILILPGCGNKSQETTVSSQETEAAEEELNEATVLRVGYLPKFGDPIIALERKYHYLEDELKAKGISVEFYEFENGPPLLEALASGGLDVGNPVGDSPFTTSTAAGYPIVGIAAACVDDTTNTMNTLVDADSGITEVSDLKGKRVAASIGTTGHLFLCKALEQAGLTTDDIELISLTDSEYLAAFEGDSIDAASTAQSLALTLADTGAAEAIDVPTIKLGKSVFIASSDYAEANPEIVAIYLKAVLHYYEYFEENRDEVQELTATTFDIPLESLASYQNVTFETGFDDDFYERLQGTIDFLVDQDTIEGLDAHAVTDSSYLEEAARLLESE